MNLHFMLDEKVISRTISYFEEALPQENKYIILTDNPSHPKFVTGQYKNCYRLKYDSNEFWAVIGDVSSYSSIITHYLSGWAVRFINKIEHNRIILIFWGADLYNGLLKPKGYKLFYNERDVNKLLRTDKSFIQIIKGAIMRRHIYRNTIQAVYKVRYICAFKGELELLVKYYPNLRTITPKDFFYYPIDDIVPDALKGVQKLGDDIVVGNSASFFGNHEEVFLHLSSINTRGRKIMVPLSYGAPSVIKYIKEKGKNILGDSFVPILNFMPLEEYNRFLCGARTFIYGNYRQEAFGNIVIALFLGGAVFLHPSNILLKELKDMGCICFSTNELQEKIHYYLADKEKLNNRNVIQKRYNIQRLLNIIKTEFSTNGVD